MTYARVGDKVIKSSVQYRYCNTCDDTYYVGEFRKHRLSPQHAAALKAQRSMAEWYRKNYGSGC